MPCRVRKTHFRFKALADVARQELPAVLRPAAVELAKEVSELRTERPVAALRERIDRLRGTFA